MTTENSDSAASSPMAEITREEDLGLGRKGSWIGQTTKRLLDKFLGDHREEWERLQDSERERAECTQTFDFFVKTLADSSQNLELLRGDIQSCLSPNTDIAMTVFQNLKRSCARPFEFLTGESAVLIFAADLLNRHGEHILKTAEAEHVALQERFETFKHEKRNTLRALGLLKSSPRVQ